MDHGDREQKDVTGATRRPAAKHALIPATSSSTSTIMSSNPLDSVNQSSSDLENGVRIDGSEHLFACKPSSTPFPHLISTYSIHINSELPLINNHIDDLETEIAYVERKIALLKDRRMQLRSEIRLHRGMTSPFRRFPAELLIKLFEHTIPIDGLNDGLPVSNQPWVLAAVCRRWRDIVVSTPTLWCSLTIDPAPNRCSVLKRIDILPAVLERYSYHSADADLYITTRDFRSVRYALGVLWAHAHRIRYLKLDIISFMDLASRPLPRLERLHLTNTIIELPRLFYHDTWTNLKHLLIEGETWLSISAFDLLKEAFPWERLTSLSIMQMYDLDSLVRLMERLSHTLVSLDISKSRNSARLSSPGQHIRMQKLLSLECDIDDENEFCQFINLLTTPSLRSLHVNTPRDEASASAINSLITRSSNWLAISSLAFIPMGHIPEEAADELYPTILVLQNYAMRGNLQELVISSQCATTVYHLLETLIEDPAPSRESSFLSIKSLTLRFLDVPNYWLSCGNMMKPDAKRMLSGEGGSVKMKLRCAPTTGIEPAMFQPLLDVFRSKGLEAEVISEESYLRSVPPELEWDEY